MLRRLTYLDEPGPCAANRETETVPDRPRRAEGRFRASRFLTRPHPGAALVLLWRGAAVVFLGIASLSAASLAAAEATGPAVALGIDAAVLCAAGLAMALTAHRLARLTVAAVTAAQLLAVAAARHLGGLPEHSGHGGHETRLLCGGAAAVATLALLAWLDDRDTDEPRTRS
jgi:hypothetical protein